MGAIALILQSLLWVNFVCVLTPFLTLFIVALTCKENTQLKVAQVVSGLTMITQMAVLVSLIFVWTTDGLCNPATWMSIWVVGIFLLAAILHPREGLNILYFPVYFVCVPTMYLVLIIYSMCNLNNISWGTREVPKTQAEKDKEAQILKENEKKSGTTSTIDAIAKGGCCSCFKPPPTNDQAVQNIAVSLSALQEDVARIQRLQLSSAVNASNSQSDSVFKRAYDSIALRLRGTRHAIPGALREIEEINNGFVGEGPLSPRPVSQSLSIEYPDPDYIDEPVAPPRDDMVNPKWAEDPDLGTGPRKELPSGEVSFWKNMIKQYLAPLDMNREYREKLAKELKELRDKSVLAFFMLNILFIALVWSLQSANIAMEFQCTNSTDPTGQTTETVNIQPVAIAFTIIFGMVMTLQVLGMLLHRLFTLLQVVSTTILFKRRRHSPEKELTLQANDVLELVKTMTHDIDLDSEGDVESLYQGLPTATSDSGQTEPKKGPTRSERRRAQRQEPLERKFARRYLALCEERKNEMKTKQGRSVDDPLPPPPPTTFSNRFKTRRYTRTERAMELVSRNLTNEHSEEHEQKIREKYNISKEEAQRLAKSAQMRKFTRKYSVFPPADYENVTANGTPRDQERGGGNAARARHRRY